MHLHLTPGPLALFGLVASITPGPNNLMLMRSGARFGVLRSLPHLAGVQLGFVMLVLLSHLGVGALLLAWPATIEVLRWLCFAYLLWLAVLILRDARPQPAASNETTPAARPMHWFEGVAFQLINPKAWMMAITVASAFYGGNTPTHLDLAAACAVSISIGSPSMLVWNIWGATIDHLLKRPRARATFACIMAAMVAATAFWMLL